MKLFLVHAGFYDEKVSGGFYESHTNYFVVAEDVKEAKKKAKEISEYKDKKMHIDGIREIDSVEDYRVTLEKKNEEAVNIEGAKYSYDDVKRI
tara:strand:+ start:11923 stop:12201 length:279 start_codon:yes stop_codon:yes gene_type:complete